MLPLLLARLARIESVEYMYMYIKKAHTISGEWQMCPIQIQYVLAYKKVSL